MIIENSFDVDADPDRVFDFLQNPHNVATCFPGAELTEDLGDDQYKGKVKIKLGPVTAAFSGIARITEKDDVARIAVLVAEGKDARGSGTAKATATMRVEPKEDGTGSSVLLKTDLTISGKLAQFGRGIMADVSNRMVGDLAKRVQERIESESREAAGAEAETAPAADAAPAEASATAETAKSEAPAAAESEATTGTASAAQADGAASDDAKAGATNTAATATAAPAKAATKAPAKAAPSAPSAEPESAIKASTMIKVVLAGMFRRLFARLRGRPSEKA